ncbi:MAG: heme A synthase, partial [Pedobacter sp.]
MMSKAEQWFVRFNFITIVVTFLVILAGGVVRSTGSGMGCPDWPKCFDRYIPPTSAAQLPPDYQQKYVDGRLKKNEKFARYMESLGRADLAGQLRNDKSITKPEVFNAS